MIKEIITGFNLEERIIKELFSQIVDLEGTADKFISNLTNYCTYIFGENTLPKESLIFQAYKVLNDLNNLKVNGSLISKEDKDYIIQNVYLKKKKIKGKDLFCLLKLRKS